jgi:hypothetical protein
MPLFFFFFFFFFKKTKSSVDSPARLSLNDAGLVSYGWILMIFRVFFGCFGGCFS